MNKQKQEDIEMFGEENSSRYVAINIIWSIILWIGIIYMIVIGIKVLVKCLSYI